MAHIFPIGHLISIRNKSINDSCRSTVLYLFLFHSLLGSLLHSYFLFFFLCVCVVFLLPPLCVISRFESFACKRLMIISFATCEKCLRNDSSVCVCVCFVSHGTWHHHKINAQSRTKYLSILHRVVAPWITPSQYLLFINFPLNALVYTDFESIDDELNS